MSSQKSRYALTTIAVLNVLLAGGGVLGTALSNSRSWLSFSVAAIAIVSFFGLLHVGRSEAVEKYDSEILIRRAIAASAVVVYLVLVSIVAFFSLEGFKGLNLEYLSRLPPETQQLVLSALQKPPQIDPLTSMLVTNFTVTIGVIVAFYFGSSAYLEAKKGRRDTTSSE
jgi:hypothetical protein